MLCIGILVWVLFIRCLSAYVMIFINLLSIAIFVAYTAAAMQ